MRVLLRVRSTFRLSVGCPSTCVLECIDAGVLAAAILGPVGAAAPDPRATREVFIVLGLLLVIVIVVLLLRR